MWAFAGPNMRLLAAVLFFAFAQLSRAQSQDGADVLALAAANLPPCAVCNVDRYEKPKTDRA
jgi:hypothetical protein